MKTTTIFKLALGMFIIPFLVFCLAFLPQQAQAQDSGYIEPSEKYSPEELAQMLAPIALYPDALLSQVLMASTYPIEVIEADRWVKGNDGLEGEALDARLVDKNWDPSVKALCYFPSILNLMSERITETTNLGNAFLAQEAEVMDMVQDLRSKAYSQGNLTTTSEQKVIVEKETIIIEQADPRVIYVPYYDPFYVYGPWWYPAYPPYYWGPAGGNIGFGISYWPGITFGFIYGSWSYFDWHHNHIYIDVYSRPRYVRHDRWRAKPGRWYHAPRHRRGVAYRGKSIARKYGQYPYRSRNFRRDKRGFPDYRSRNRDFNRDSMERRRVNRDRQINERAPQQQTRIDREQQTRERANRNTMERQRIKRDRQVNEQASRKQAIIDREQQSREQANRTSMERQRTKRDRQVNERTSQKQARRDRDRQIRKQTQQQKPVRKRVDRGRSVQQKRAPFQRSDNVFNRVDKGSRERKYSERGRVSRQGRGNKSQSMGGRPGSSNRGGRGGRSRNTR